jgi:RNA polymerase sigma-70 factor, ECF subfamily
MPDLHAQSAVSLPALPTFAAIYARHGPFVWRSLRRLGVREADLEDLCQEVFLVVHRKLSEFDGRSTLGTWIFGICLKMASDHRRRAHVRRETTAEEPPEEAVPPGQPEAVERRQARAVLDRILERLDDQKRAAFILYELEQWPMAEVATAMGCPLQTAYSRLHAARRQVQEAVAQGTKEWSAA